MAPVPAQLNFSFDSNYTAGCYRVATRIQGSGDPYTITAVNCTPFVPPTTSVPCVVQIPITVDDETCAPVTYEGYVQPCCQDEESLDGRVAFTVTFTPNPTCKSYQLTCDSVGINAVLVTTPGSGYTPGGSEVVTFGDPNGTLADAECKVEDDGVEAFTSNLPQAAVTANGLYSEIQGVNLVVAGAPVPGYFDITVVGNVATAIAMSSLLDNPAATGSGYTVGDTITFAAPFNNIILTVTNIYDNGEILVCQVNAPGSGYTGPTIASINPPGAGITPTLEVVYEYCNPTEYFGVGCDGDITPARPDVALGVTVQLCRQGDVGAPPANMSIVEGGCCADQTCETITITAADPGYDGNFWYIDCCSKQIDSPTTKRGGGIDPVDIPLTINYLVGSLIFDPPGSESLLTITGPTPYVCP